MIPKNSKRYCCEDISLIENYEQALNDQTQIWHCHHRLETELGLSSKELIEFGVYFNRPASELIFMPPEEHLELHNKGENNPMYGKPLSEEHRANLSKALKGKSAGEKNGMYGKGYLISGEKNGMFGKHQTEEAKAKQSKASKGENNPMYGKNSEDFMTEEAIREKRRKYSESMKGVNKNRKWMNNGEKNVFVAENEVDEYIKNGYIFGMIRRLHNK